MVEDNVVVHHILGCDVAFGDGLVWRAKGESDGNDFGKSIRLVVQDGSTFYEFNGAQFLGGVIKVGKFELVLLWGQRVALRMTGK